MTICDAADSLGFKRIVTPEPFELQTEDYFPPLHTEVYVGDDGLLTIAINRLNQRFVIRVGDISVKGFCYDELSDKLIAMLKIRQ